MPVAYSLDLRQKIVDAFENGDYTADEIAEMFNVHRAYVYKLLKQLSETGTLEPLPHGGGHEFKLKPEHREVLKEILKENPDVTLEQMCEQAKEKISIEVSISTMSRTLRIMRISFKKRRGGL